MAVFLIPSLWLIDTLFGVYSDDANTAKILTTVGIVLPIVIGIGLVLDTLRYFFPAIFEEKLDTEISSADRVINKLKDAGTDT